MRGKKEKHCRVCGVLFAAHPQAAKIQKTCPKKTCRRAADRNRYRRWIKLHPDYECSPGRRQPARAWAYQWPHYWKDYRKNNPDYTARDNRRRARVLKAARRSAKQTGWKDAAVEKLRSLQDLGRLECSANQTAWDPRDAGLIDCVLSTVGGPCSANQTPMDNTGARPG